jgi:hypothetical protein
MNTNNTNYTVTEVKDDDVTGYTFIAITVLVLFFCMLDCIRTLRTPNSHL